MNWSRSTASKPWIITSENVSRRAKTFVSGRGKAVGPALIRECRTLVYGNANSGPEGPRAQATMPTNHYWTIARRGLAKRRQRLLSLAKDLVREGLCH